MIARVFRDPRGFSIIEMMIAIAIVTIVLAGGVLALDVGLQTMKVSAGRAETQSNARIAVGRMVPDIREAGYDPTGAAFPAVLNQTATSVTLHSDRNASGVIDTLPAGTCDATAPSEEVRYRLVGNQLLRSVNTAAGACETVVVGGVQGLTFTYLDDGGVITAVGADIRTIAISVTMLSEASNTDPHLPTSSLMTDRVRLRNR